MSLDLLRARVAFRDRSFMDILDLALRFVRTHAGIYGRVTLVVVAPLAAIAIASAQLWGWGIGFCIAFLTSLVAEVPFTVLASRLVFQDRVAARDVLRDSLRDLPRMLGMRFVWLVVVAFASNCLFVPVFYVGAVALFVSEVMLLERSSLGAAIRRSHRIATSALGDAAIGFLAAVLLPLIGVVLAEVAGRMLLQEVLQFRAPAPFWETGGSSVLTLLGWFAVIPYTTTARFFVYLNSRTRAEGWDIQTRFAAIAARAEREAVEEAA